jgi:uncharacterized protein (TIGR03032 family)
VRSSYFSASSDRLTKLAPGDPDYPVDRRGVVFSGATREPMLRGLTRPHSVRLRGRRVFVNNSGYGETGFGDDGVFRPVARFSGWTRGLCFAGRFAFVGTSRVIPRFRSYAPGLDVAKSACGVHALDLRKGEVVGSIVWPFGSQIYGLETVPAGMSLGFPSVVGRASARSRRDLERLFYAFATRATMEHEP